MQRNVIRIFVDHNNEIACDIRLSDLSFNQAFAINTRLDQMKAKVLELVEVGFRPLNEDEEKKMDGAG